jgi:hypothetical protein
MMDVLSALSRRILPIMEFRCYYSAMAVAAVLFVLLVIFTARFTLGGRGVLIGRFAAILSVYILIWLAIAINSPSEAGGVASFGASGVAEAVSGLVHFLGSILPH